MYSGCTFKAQLHFYRHELKQPHGISNQAVRLG